MNDIKTQMVNRIILETEHAVMDAIISSPDMIEHVVQRLNIVMNDYIQMGHVRPGFSFGIKADGNNLNIFVLDKDQNEIDFDDFVNSELYS